MSTSTLTLFYDGLCPLCSREIEHYRRKALGQPVAFVDITDPHFDAAAHGLDVRRIHAVMHVKRGDAVLTGVDAFIAVWQALPAYRWLARLARLPGANWLLHVGYHAFAAVRPHLPRLRQPLCVDGTCRR
jgi:predicted DCC family thiol-disulfide oxidoreductase YuxK